MKIKWKKLLCDSAAIITFPVWIVPGLLLVAVLSLVEVFLENYTE